MSSALSIVAMNTEAMQVLLDDGTILTIRSAYDADNNACGWGEATAMLVVDHRTKPPTFAHIKLDAIDFAGEAN